MPNCAVFGCGNHNKRTKGTDIKYYRFPKQVDMADQWIDACCRVSEINIKNACICSQHFEKSCFEIPLRQRLLNYDVKSARHLKPDAIPTVNLGQPKQINSSPIRKKREGESKRSGNLNKRRNQQEVDAILKVPKVESCIAPVQIIEKNVDLSSTATTSTTTSRRSPPKLNDCFNNDNNSPDTLIRMREEIITLKAEKAALLKKIEILEKRPSAEALLGKIFTPGQIKKLKNPNHNIHWSSEDIAAAISLHGVSPKAYRYLRSLKYPLPALSTLRMWAST